MHRDQLLRRRDPIKPDTIYSMSYHGVLRLIHIASRPIYTALRQVSDLRMI